MKATRGRTTHTARTPRHRAATAQAVNVQDQLDKSLQHLLLDDEWDEVSDDDTMFPDRDFRTVDD